MNGLGRLLTAEQLADELGVTKRKVYRWRDEHGLPATSVGRSLYFRSSDVAAWLTANRAGDAPAVTDGAGPWTPEAEEAPPSASPQTQHHPTAA